MSEAKVKEILENIKTYKSIAARAHYLATQMIYMANDRADVEKGDPKIGGHVSASASALHIMGTLHLIVKSGFDQIANKPHASPADHAYNYLLDLFLNKDLSRFTLEEANQAMSGLRAFSKNGEPVFQSYHSIFDPDHHNFFPSGTVGIPPVQAGYMALAYRYAREHGFKVPDAHFWALIGDSEFREGSLFEAIPDFAERELGHLTWIIDYNRQSLDGHRMGNKAIMQGTDDMRIEKTMTVNGWDVIQVRHGHKRQELFARKGGEKLRTFLEKEITDYELQAMLMTEGKPQLRQHIHDEHKQMRDFLETVDDDELYIGINDLGGHDMVALTEAFLKSKKNPRKPCMILAHTLKGWHLKMAAKPGNHSALPDEAEMLDLRRRNGLNEDDTFVRFAPSTAEGKLLKKRGDLLHKEIKEQHELKEKNRQQFLQAATQFGEVPRSLEVSLKMASYPHTQWMLGQLTAKLTRIANTPLDPKKLGERQKPLDDFEKRWKLPGELIVSMAPDVGTSTNLNPSMDGKIFGVAFEDLETEMHVKDDKMPDLIPGEEVSDRFLRFEIAEANVMSCMGSFGRLKDTLGIPILPLMTVYDFFIKRALDQYFYDLYWKSSFILVGTPSGVTLSPEGAQHGWKSDIQIPNQITWEPFYCQELDWILSDSIRRHVLDDNEGRTGVLIRGVTRGAEQKDFMRLLKTQLRFQDKTDEEILSTIREDVLQGAYHLINYSGYEDYNPGDNVINIFSMGSMTTEAIKASEALKEKGIFANVVVVTSPDLLCGNLGHDTNYHHLRNNLNINSDLYLQPQMNGNLTSGELRMVSGRRVPIVSVHDGEPGLLDNLGSIVGVRQESLAVRKHSKCGRPIDVYRYHHIDSESVIEACGKALSETALEQVQVSPRTLNETSEPATKIVDWRELWRH